MTDKAINILLNSGYNQDEIDNVFNNNHIELDVINGEYTIYSKQLAAIGDISFFNYGSVSATFFSKDMIEEQKLDNPYQLVYDGKWTLDALAKMATDTARDVNGNGVVTGLTEVSEINSFHEVNGERIPCEGELFYRGVNIKDIVKGASDNGQPSEIALICAFIPFGKLF